MQQPLFDEEIGGLDYVAKPGAQHSALPADPEAGWKSAAIGMPARIHNYILTYINISNNLNQTHHTYLRR